RVHVGPHAARRAHNRRHGRGDRRVRLPRRPRIVPGAGRGAPGEAGSARGARAGRRPGGRPRVLRAERPGVQGAGGPSVGRHPVHAGGLRGDDRGPLRRAPHVRRRRGGRRPAARVARGRPRPPRLPHRAVDPLPSCGSGRTRVRHLRRASGAPRVPPAPRGCDLTNPDVLRRVREHVAMARLTVVLLAGAIALTACSSGGTTSAVSGGSYSAEVGSTDLYAKAPQRFQIGVFRSSDQGVQLLTSGAIDIQLTPFQGGPGTPLQGKAHYVGAPGTGADTGTPELTDPSTARGVYEFDGTFDTPGVWQA